MRTAQRWGVALVLACVASLVWPASSLAKPTDQAAADEEARVHFRLGVAYHDSGRFADAAAEFEQAYALSERPKLLYNLFLAYRDGGNIAKAADALERYLALEGDAPERDKLTARLAALERILANQAPAEAQAQHDPAQASEPDAVTPPQGETTTLPPVVSAEPRTTERNPWHKYTPWVAMGTGVVMMGVGAAVGSIALSDYNRCKEQGCESGELDSGTTKARLADAMLFGGAAVAATGLVLYFVLPREREVRTTGGIACAPGGCAASLTHRF